MVLGIYFRNEKAAQRVRFGAGYPADVHADIPADVPAGGKNFGQALENKHFGADIHGPKARTSMTPKNSGQNNFGLNVRSLLFGNNFGADGKR